MDKRQLHHTYTRFRVVRAWYFLILALISLSISAYYLRQNNLEMVRLRDAVYVTDKNGGDIETALKNLRSYVGQHMNTNLASGPNAVHPPIQLKYTYNRLTNAQNQASTTDGSTVYSDAQGYCEQRVPTGVSGSNRLTCVQDYIRTHQATPDPSVSPEKIPKNLYQFDFASPWWSPDAAGWSLALSAFLFLCALVTFVIQLFMKRLTRRS